MIAQSGRWTRTGNRIVLLPSAGGGAPAAEMEEETGPGPAATPGTPRAPAGLRLLPHLHVRKTLPSGTRGAGPVAMNAAAMNPGFVNPTTDTLVLAAGLQSALNGLIASKHKKIGQKIGVALVDLTGSKLFAPQLAGWRSTVPVTGASTPKICALYAVHQLRFELQALANSSGITTEAALVAAAKAAWSARGLTKAQPDLTLFTFTASPPGPVTVTLAAETRDQITCCFEKNENRAASLLISRVGLPYISSLMWQSGLFHPVRSGLWLTDHYGAGCVKGPACCFMKRKVPVPAPGAVAVKPRASTTHNLTALSAAAYFTLMAQGRLGDDATSLAIRRDLEPACSFLWTSPAPLSCVQGRVPTKCGIWSTFKHDVALVQRSVGAGCTGKVIRYAIAVTTAGVPSTFSFPTFLKDVDALVVANNP